MMCDDLFALFSWLQCLQRGSAHWDLVWHVCFGVSLLACTSVAAVVVVVAAAATALATAVAAAGAAASVTSAATAALAATAPVCEACVSSCILMLLPNVCRHVQTEHWVSSVCASFLCSPWRHYRRNISKCFLDGHPDCQRIQNPHQTALGWSKTLSIKVAWAAPSVCSMQLCRIRSHDSG